MIQLDQVTKRFGDLVALQPLDLVVEAGRTTVLIGPSGCGKSTLLRLIVGLETPDSGSVTIAGERLESANALAVRRRMGYVVQDGGLFPHLSARDNITLMARHLRWDGARIEEHVQELCELTHLPADALVRYPIQLSGGQQQRVSLMRALMLDPEVLLLDEPLGALDPMIRFELQRDLREAFDRLQKTVVVVTHDLGEAAFLGQEIVLLRAGAVVQRGALTTMLRRPADEFVARFIRAQRAPLAALESGA